MLIKKVEIMKKIILSVLLLLGGIGISNAQEKGPVSAIWYQASSFISLNGHTEMTAIDLVFAPGYAFNKYLFARLQGELSVGLFDVQPVRTYEINGLLGLSLGSNFFRSPDIGIFEGAVTVGNTIENKNWSFIYYDASVKWGMTSRYPITPTWGIGVRYYQSHNSNFNNFCNLYVSIGFTTNRPASRQRPAD